jgi:NADP-dependent 3-hydroxy acid dehydrogenase YdfG
MILIWLILKNVLIIGAAGGVGSATTKRLIKLGANVAIWDIDEKRLKALESDIQDSGYKVAISKVVDIRNAKQVQDAGEELLKSFDVDILFNTAGYCHQTDSINDSDDRIERIIDTNMKGYIFPIRFFWRRFIEKRSGHIVSMASVAGVAGIII